MPGLALSVVRTGSGQSVGWHSHQNPHLTLILRGQLIEGTKSAVYRCSAGQLLFHSSFEPHYNNSVEGSVVCLHIDYTQSYFDEMAGADTKLRGIFDIPNSEIKLSCYRAFREAMLCDDVSSLSIHTLLLEVLGRLLRTESATPTQKPRWVAKLNEILRCRYAERITLDELSKELNIHPVHLSRSFSRYFHCTMGDFIRNLRMEESLRLMSSGDLSLTGIAASCGFADQSHFTRWFKERIGSSPSNYRKLLAE
jgi:AraC family transcriptional regulator